MTFENKELKVEKDAMEVADLLVGIVKFAKEKKDPAVLLPQLITAIEGITSVPASYKVDKSCVIGSFLYKMSEVIDVLVEEKA